MYVCKGRGVYESCRCIHRHRCDNCPLIAVCTVIAVCTAIAVRDVCTLYGLLEVSIDGGRI